VIRNLDMLDSVGDVPDELLVSILNWCAPGQLKRLEDSSKQKLDTANMWKRHCEKDYGSTEEDRKRHSQERGKNVTWRALWFVERQRLAQKKEKVCAKLSAMYKTEAEEKMKRRIQVVDCHNTTRKRGRANVSTFANKGSCSPTSSRDRLRRKLGIKSASSAKKPLAKNVIVAHSSPAPLCKTKRSASATERCKAAPSNKRIKR